MTPSPLVEPAGQALLTPDDALNDIVRHLLDLGRVPAGQHGYQLTIIRLAERYVRDVLGRNHPDPVENEDTYAVSIAFYDAAWELARRGILRPSVHNSFMQFDAFQAAGGGYTLTGIGAEWLAGLGNERLRVRDRWGPFSTL